MNVHLLNIKRSRRIRKENMVGKDQRIKEDPKRKERGMKIRSSATTSTLEKGPAVMVPNVGSSTRIELVEEKQREDSTTSSKS